ncbi:MAG: hypothetical protein QXG39_04980 [Candidatus Aenigmatarchaeota archaeon]
MTEKNKQYIELFMSDSLQMASNKNTATESIFIILMTRAWV